jgi:hypothetical protein
VLPWNSILFLFCMSIKCNCIVSRLKFLLCYSQSFSVHNRSI